MASIRLITPFDEKFEKNIVFLLNRQAKQTIQARFEFIFK